MRTKTLPRRTLLRGLGAVIALPALEAMARADFAPRAATSAPAGTPRVIFCYVPNGKNIFEWTPKGSGSGYQLSKTLDVIKRHRADFTVISGLGHPRAKGGHAGADTWLTAADLSAAPGVDYSNSVSIDQQIAELHGPKTRFASLELADGNGAGAPGHSFTLAFDQAGTPLPAENSPVRLFSRLFTPDEARDRQALLRRIEDRRSILDGLLAESKLLRGTLGLADRHKLDEYLASVRAAEARLKRAAAWVDVKKPHIDNAGLKLFALPQDKHDRGIWLEVMLQLAYLAFVTDSTRVISYGWATEAGGAGDGVRDHHELSHHGGDATMLERLGAIDRFHVDHLGKLLDLLAATKEGPDRLLDRTLVLYGCGMDSGAGGGHSPKNLPLLLAGGRKLGLKHGHHLAFDPNRHPPMSNLLLTIAQRMGVKAARFKDSTGVLAGIG